MSIPLNEPLEKEEESFGAHGHLADGEGLFVFYSQVETFYENLISLLAGFGLCLLAFNFE